VQTTIVHKVMPSQNDLMVCTKMVMLKMDYAPNASRNRGEKMAIALRRCENNECEYSYLPEYFEACVIPPRHGQGATHLGLL